MLSGLLFTFAPGIATPAGDGVAYTVANGIEIPEPLSPTTPDPDRGGVIYLDPDRGACGACHSIAGLPNQARNEKQAGPDLDRVAARLSASELRLVIVNPQIIRPDAAMPAYFNVSEILARADPEARQPILARREIEDVIAFLTSLTIE